MPFPPMNVYGRSADAEGIAQLIAETWPTAKLERSGDAFVITAGGSRRLRAAAPKATMRVDGRHFEGDEGERQRLGLANFLRTNMGGSGAEMVRAMVLDLATAVSLTTEAWEETGIDDALFDLALAVAVESDGFVLSLGHGVVVGQGGEELLSVDALVEPEPAAPAAAEPEVPAAVPEPPDLERVQQRLVVLNAVGARGIAEAEAQFRIDARAAFLAWATELDTTGEAEEAERVVLNAAAGLLSARDRVDASWRIEGAAVLAWALGLLELPPHDRQLDPTVLFAKLGFPRPDASRQILAATHLRPVEEIETLANRLFAVHWRLRDQRLNPRHLDFADFARTAWFGPLDIEGVALVDGDVAVGGRPLLDADPELVQAMTSAISERHLAANWLLAGGRYSETDNST